MRLRNTLLIAMILANGVIAANARGDQKDIDRFLREYPGAAQTWSQAYARVRGLCLSYALHGKFRKRVCKNTFAIDHGHKKVEIERLPDPKDDNGWTQVYCLGPDTAFVLNKQ